MPGLLMEEVAIPTPTAKALPSSNPDIASKPQQHSTSVVVTDTRSVSYANEHLDSSLTQASVFELGPLTGTVSPVVPICVVFLYKSEPTTQPIAFERLQRALELLLDYYPQLTGRLNINQDGSCSIKRLGTGVTLLAAESTEKLEALSEGRISVTDLPGASGTALFAPFPVRGPTQDPLLDLQFTRFACGGIALGVRIRHVCTDAEGFFQLMEDLAELYRGLAENDTPTLKKKPSINSQAAELNKLSEEELSVAREYKPALFHIKPAAPGGQEVGAPMSKPGPPNMNRPPPNIGRVLHFSSTALEALKVEATDPSNTKSFVSTFDALSALLYQQIYRARLQVFAKVPAALTPPDFLTPINLRSRNKALPDRYFPAALFTAITSIPQETLKEVSLSVIAQHTHDLTRGPQVDIDAIQKTSRWVAAQPDKRRVSNNFRPGPGSLMISQWNKFDMYNGMQFVQDQRPMLVSTPFTPFALVDGLGYFLPAGPENSDRQAIDVNISLSAGVWKVLDSDEVLQRYLSA